MDEAQIRQLIFNLVRNGIEAMPEGGALTIGAFQDYEGINLVIQDSGCGIPPELASQIEAPFFTTKAGGTGLGLAICKRIVEKHNAVMEFGTSPRGTVFKITLPPAY